MPTAHELPSTSSTPSSGSSASEHPLNDEARRGCDFCGCAVTRETAVQRVEQRADGPEVVVLCSDCAFGND